MSACRSSLGEGIRSADSWPATNGLRTNEGIV